MTNYEKWRLFTDGLISPDNYIDFGYYFLIGASLQRRVWLGPNHAPIFPNPYTILVGDPSVGKTLVIKPVAEILKHHHLPEPDINKHLTEGCVDKADIEQAKALAEEDYKRATNDRKMKDKPLLFPVAADATTWEALVRCLADSLRYINYKEFDAKLGRERSKPYAHSSLSFCLEEISSLFRRKAEEVVNFLLKTYDCGDYDYDTKTAGKDRVRRCCVSLLGGTTPAFMQRVFEDELLNEGIASRTWFIFASENRKSHFFVPSLTTEQEQARIEIIDHIEKLSHLYGRIHIDSSTEAWLENWQKESHYKRANLSIKLNHYYGRKNLHVAKLAIAIHFSDSLEMHMGREPFEQAISIFEIEEKRMHYALGLETTNPLASPAKKILKYLEQCGRKTFKELLAEFWEILPSGKSSLEEILEHLQGMSKIKRTTDEHPLTKATTIYYLVPTKIEINGKAVKLEQPIKESSQS